MRYINTCLSIIYVKIFYCANSDFFSKKKVISVNKIVVILGFLKEMSYDKNPSISCVIISIYCQIVQFQLDIALFNN